MRPLKIAILNGNQHDRSFRIRCQTPLSWLQSRRAIEVIPTLNAWEADVVMLFHQWQAEIPGLVSSLRRHGVRVVADLDEDIFTAPAEHPSSKLYRDPAFQARVRQVLGAVDCTFVPSAHLAAKLDSPRTSVTPNGIDSHMWRALPKGTSPDRVRVVGFAGTASQVSNLELVRPALAKLSKKFKEDEIRFVCFGFRPPWLAGILSASEAYETCSMEAYPKRLAGLGFDIALAPLANSEFNKSRSPLKFLEYTAAGSLTVATDADPYASAIQNGVTGLLVDHQPDSWVQAVSRLIRNHDLRAQMRAAAQRALEAHDVSQTAPALLAALEATNPNRDRVLFAFPRTQSQICTDVDVVIPVYNSPVLTRQAIEAALPELDSEHRLIVVNDASPDPAIASMLDEYAPHPWITVHHSEKNSGFVGTCNLAVTQLARPDADVILMNADTRPMPGFVKRLAASAGSNPAIGAVTAVSNQGWIASVPDFEDAPQLAALQHPLILSPTACGFLLYIKREVIRKYGLFDPAFSPGYCEEVDLSLRIAPEYSSVIDPGCWTWHANSVSFGDAKYQLSADHNAEIDRRYPHFRFELGAFNANHPLLAHRRAMLQATTDSRTRVLHVLQSHGNAHGTGKHVHDLSEGLSEKFLSLAAASNQAADPTQERLELYCGDVPITSWPYAHAGWPQAAAQIPANDQAWLSLLNEVKPALIHFHHLKNHPLNLLASLTGAGLPVVVSLHDYFFLCPDSALVQCPGVHSCDTCYPRQFQGPADYQRLRRALLHASLTQASAIVAPSQSAADLVRQVYPGLNILVIPHGLRAYPRFPRKPCGKVRFGMIGNVNSVKGIDLMLAAWPVIANAADAELHVYGASEPEYIPRMAAAGVHYHGAYCEDQLPRILSEIDVGVLPSQAPETFSYALSEFFAGGVPVIGSDFGALSERIENGVNGFRIVRNDLRAWVSVLSRLIRDPALRERIARGVTAPESIPEMAAQYAEIYREVIARSQIRAVGLTAQEALQHAQ